MKEKKEKEKEGKERKEKRRTKKINREICGQLTNKTNKLLKRREK
jgi:hypothetical protein